MWLWLSRSKGWRWMGWVSAGWLAGVGVGLDVDVDVGAGSGWRRYG